jgi:Leucine-rich repeat (LRR) protein
MQQSAFDNMVSAYQQEVLIFQRDYPTEAMQEALDDYPALQLPPNNIYDTINTAQFAWICDNLTLYNVEFEAEFHDYSLLRKQTNLRVLKISKSVLTDISWLSELTGLIELELNNNQIVDISALANCKNIDILALAGNQIEDISALANCRKMTYLDLDRNPIKDLLPLAGLPQLDRFYFMLKHRLLLEPLGTLPKLRYLDINMEIGMSLAALSCCRPLINLNIKNSYLDTNYDYALIPNLKDLSISISTFTKLPPLPKTLEAISFLFNQITDISPLADLPNLQNIRLSGNPITMPPPPCLLKCLYLYKKDFVYPYGKPSRALPPDADKIWALLMTNDSTNRDLAEQLMRARHWHEADIDAYIRMAEKIKE